MSIDGGTSLDVTVRNLLKLGFSEYQAKVYTGLLALSESTASELVELVTVPKARVYQILDELLEMGLIRKKPGRPIKYVTLPPDTGLENLLKWKKEKNKRELDSLAKTRDGLINDLLEVYRKEKIKPSAKKSFIEVLPSGELSEIETKKAYISARKEIMILTGVFEYLPRVIKEIKNSAKRGVRVRILLLDSEKLRTGSDKIQNEVVKVLKEVENVDIRFALTMPLRGTVVDSSLAIFSVDEGQYLPFQKELAISENKNMVMALNIYFNALWEKAKE